MWLKKPSGARGSGISARLKNTHEIPRSKLRHRNISGNHIEGRTERPNDVGTGRSFIVHATDGGNGNVSLDHLTNISRSCEMMVHAAVHDDELLDAR